MSAQKHTSRPWMAVVANEFDPAYIEAIGKSKHTVAQGMTPSNARLIAAAPELLEVLKFSVKYGHLGGCPQWSDENKTCQCYVSKAEQVIAKAEGRT